MARLIATIGMIMGVGLGLTLPSCIEGGANTNQQQQGNNNVVGGINIGDADVGIAPDGSYFLTARSRTSLLSGTTYELVIGDLLTGKVSFVQIGYQPKRVAFAEDSKSFYVVGSPYRVTAYDAATKAAKWHFSDSSQGSNPRIYVNKDSSRLMLASLVWGGWTLLESSTGQVVDEGGEDIEDIDFTADGNGALITHTTEWRGQGPVTVIDVIDAVQGGVDEQIEVPNCSSNLMLSKDGKRAFVAPTNCQKDPVSVVDVENREFVRNLPGFGPVAVASDGVTAVAFIDTMNIDASLFLPGEEIPSSSVRYHLMLIDADTLQFSTLPLGDTLPRYALTPDGKIVLVDHNAWCSSSNQSCLSSNAPIRVLDIAKKQFVDVDGPRVALEHYAMSPDSQDVYLIYDGKLYWLSIDEAKVYLLDNSKSWSSLNITDDGSRLLLHDGDGELQLLNLETSKVEQVILL